MNEPVNDATTVAGLSAFRPRAITGPVLAGVVPGQPTAVVQHAAELAHYLQVKLICAYVDITTYLAGSAEDENEAAQLNPAAVVDDAEGVSAAMRGRLQIILDGAALRWSFLTLSGNPAQALGQLGESADASFIVVGTREPRLGTRLEQLLVGSVAVQLTRRQHRPFLVIPLARQTPRDSHERSHQ